MLVAAAEAKKTVVAFGTDAGSDRDRDEVRYPGLSRGSRDNARSKTGRTRHGFLPV
jgi:hypothetical protein